MIIGIIFDYFNTNIILRIYIPSNIKKRVQIKLSYDLFYDKWINIFYNWVE